MANALILADSARTRYLTGAMMYFAQGVPYGLLHIAIPAWLASQGIGAGAIASYLAVIILPWAFKLVTGPLMDSWQYLPMGRRRPWVLGAQLGLTLSLLALALVDSPSEQIGLLMLVGVLINSFAATQDVAVDGMSIDLTPVNEQGRLNAFMAFGKSIGWAASSAVTGVLLVTFGIVVTAIVCAAVAGAILLVFAFVLERRGERRLPWSRGEAAGSARAGRGFGAVFSGINAVLWQRASLVLLAIMFFDGLVNGYGHALMPIAAIQLFGFTTPEWSQLVAMMGLVGAVVSLGLGPLIDRFGPKRMLFLTVGLVALHAFLLAWTQQLWTDTTYMRVMLSAWVLMGPVVMVCVIALAMSICGTENSATQFAIYMSVANLGASAGSKLYGLIAERSDYVESYILMGVLTVIVAVAIMFYRHRHHHERDAGRGARQYTVGSGPGQGGMFWSGAMRCPKCRADMEIINVDGIEVDRCGSCGGLWFDAGEAEQLKTKRAAATLDTGSRDLGRKQNEIDDYRCPRCGGSILRMVDPEQRHIWYEKCGACHGSFFDAGEFADLSSHTVADFFRQLVAPERR